MNADTIHIRMPDLGDVSKAVVVQWLHPIDAHLTEGDDLLEVETEKTTFVIPAPASGRLAAIHMPETTAVTTGQVLGEIEPQ
ncbi:biotin attachment protein [Candidatus Bipolaricaulota bacterium]|jgi:pyruvate/2-oxoglutarate dehydrogenase complex dihydrolipoamide acyltransferase (E2) component|nr:biotin attachment protein [Candidatus Bipolaricaulota bacterium]TFH08209.1 MAG: biotin attachment protein [Candidatus Atribacteria bacterium]